MKNSIISLFVLLVLFSNLFSQSENTLDSLIAKYNSFDYTGAIDVANNLIGAKQNFTDDELIRVYVIKGIAHYSLGQLESAKISFTNILELDNSYDLDPVNISPKIVSFFNSIKENYTKQEEPSEPKIEEWKTLTDEKGGMSVFIPSYFSNK